MPEITTIKALKLNDIISCSLYGVGTINTIVNGLIVSMTTGLGLNNPIAAAAEHANLYASIPVDLENPIPNDYTLYNYLVVKLPDATVIEVGIPWLNPITLTRLQRKTATVVLRDFDPDQLQTLQDTLNINGFVNRTITMQ